MCTVLENKLVVSQLSLIIHEILSGRRGSRAYQHVEHMVQCFYATKLQKNHMTLRKQDNCYDECLPHLSGFKTHSWIYLSFLVASRDLQHEISNRLVMRRANCPDSRPASSSYLYQSERRGEGDLGPHGSRSPQRAGSARFRGWSAPTTDDVRARSALFREKHLNAINKYK